MSAQLDVQTVLFPYLYTAPSELPKYTSKAIRQTAEYISTSTTFDKSDYKKCPAFKDAIGESFNLWYPIWNGDNMCYPVDGTIADVLQELTPDGSYQEMFEASIRRFTGILEQIAFAIYPNTGETTANAVQEFIYKNFWQLIDDAEQNETEAYEDM